MQQINIKGQDFPFQSCSLVLYMKGLKYSEMKEGEVMVNYTVLHFLLWWKYKAFFRNRVFMQHTIGSLPGIQDIGGTRTSLLFVCMCAPKSEELYISSILFHTGSKVISVKLIFILSYEQMTSISLPWIFSRFSQFYTQFWPKFRFTCNNLWLLVAY